MPYRRIDTDFSMMKKAGMNVIRVAESTWSTWEPENGRFDFAILDEILAKAEEYGLWVIVGTPTYAIPSWMEKEHPDVMVTTPQGRRKYGHRQYMDIINPWYRKYAERIIRKLIGHVCGHPRLIGYQIDNETRYYENSTDQMKALFKQHLQETFHTTDALNQAYGLAYWSNSIASWEDFPDPDGTINAGIAGEYDRFRRHVAAEFLRWQYDIVREYKRDDQFITHNFDFDFSRGYSYGVRPDMNHYEASFAMDICGCDIYHPSQEQLTGAEIAFGGDSTRTLKGKNYFVIETQAQGFKEWTPYPGQLKQQAISHLASGADALLYWNWHSIHNSAETYWKGVLSHDLEENRIYREAAEIGRILKEHGADLLHMTKKNRIALVVDNHSLTALKWFPMDSTFGGGKFGYNDAVRWVYDALYECNLECDVVDVKGLDPFDYAYIVTPSLYVATEEMLHKLEAFVHAGGILVSTLRSFVADDHYSVYHDRAPHLMTDVFGMYYQEISGPGNACVDGKEAQHMLELLKPSGCESIFYYEDRYWSRYAAATRNQYGKGYAYYVGTVTGKETLKKILLEAYQNLPEARTEGAKELLKFPLILRNGRTAAGVPIHFLFNYSHKSQEIRNPFQSATDLLTGRQYQKGEKLFLSDWGSMILKEDQE